MRTNIPVAAIIVLVWACAAFGQGAPGQQIPDQPASMYDPSYRGPVNYWGQPTYNVIPGQPGQQQQGQPQQPTGYVFQAGEGLQAIGGYLWSYMPAPFRGQPEPFTMKPNAGQVIINYVPGVP